MYVGDGIKELILKNRISTFYFPSRGRSKRSYKYENKPTIKSYVEILAIAGQGDPENRDGP